MIDPDFDFGEIFWERQAGSLTAFLPCCSQYRLPPHALARPRKACPAKLLRLTAADLGQREVESAGLIVCVAITGCSGFSCVAMMRRLALSRRTTLVLDVRTPDFSTDASNSALITSDEISAPLAGPQEEKQEREEKED